MRASRITTRAVTLALGLGVAFLPACRRTEDLGENTLSVLNGAPSLLAIQPIHLITAIRQQRCWPVSALTLMEAAVKEQLVAARRDKRAVMEMRRQRPLAVPVGHHSERETATDERREVVKHQPSLTVVGRRRVVNANEEMPHHLRTFPASVAVSTPPYLRSRAANASTARARSSSVKSGHATSVK